MANKALKRIPIPAKIEKESHDQEFREVISANSKFAPKIIAILKTEKGNLACSPIGLSIVTAMVKLGSYGKGAEELESTFNFSSSNDKLINGYSKLLSRYKQPQANSSTVIIASKIFVESQLKLNKEFDKNVQLLSTSSTVAQLVFTKNVIAAANMNDWVKDHSQGDVDKIISPNEINAGTKIVLLNAIHLSAQWEEPHNRILKKPFKLNESETVDVEMLYWTSGYKYTSLSDLGEILVVPYKGGSLSMVVYVPNPGTELSTAEELIGQKGLEFILKETSPAKRQMFLPLFKISSTFSLVESLQKLGVETLFKTEGGNLDGIGDRKHLFVFCVIQEACFEVTREGTETSPSTSKPNGDGIGSKNDDIVVDRPFIFQIVNHSCHLLLLQGRVTNPLVK